MRAHIAPAAPAPVFQRKSSAGCTGVPAKGERRPEKAVAVQDTVPEGPALMAEGHGGLAWGFLAAVAQDMAAEGRL